MTATQNFVTTCHLKPPSLIEKFSNGRCSPRRQDSGPMQEAMKRSRACFLDSSRSKQRKLLRSSFHLCCFFGFFVYYNKHSVYIYIVDQNLGHQILGIGTQVEPVSLPHTPFSIAVLIYLQLAKQELKLCLLLKHKHTRKGTTKNT